MPRDATFEDLLREAGNFVAKQILAGVLDPLGSAMGGALFAIRLPLRENQR